ncbi:hypothetical protein [Nonomuraea guangzhouensis]|uniref:hypothetical protein n=1 Tax=Nonomuraea guangzhouensis TaxID=1291555 RepID=UPI001C5FB353|nr:hypothetical protein [Nonomuraea guangzhouensis]
MACVAVVGAAGAANAANAASGRLTLIGDIGAVTFNYTTCQPPVQYHSQLREINSFLNQPPPDCQAILVNPAGARKVLCVGRGNVPFEFRQATQIIIQPGTAPNCGFEPTGRD